MLQLTKRKNLDPFYQTRNRYVIIQRRGNRGYPLGEVFVLNESHIVTGSLKGLKCERRQASHDTGRARTNHR